MQVAGKLKGCRGIGLFRSQGESEAAFLTHPSAFSGDGTIKETDENPEGGSMRGPGKKPSCIEVRGARVHNLKNIDVDIPLGKLTAVAGVSGSGKSSLALGVLYAEGSRRYLEALSTYTRRRMTQAEKADAEEVRYVPAALALHQRPGIPGVRSTFGTSTELLNSLRLLFSRLGSHRCRNGHYVKPSMAVSLMKEIVCPVCGAHFYGPGAEDLSFNSGGACRTCGGTGLVRTVDESTLVPDESLSIDEGAVLPWQTLMWSLMKDIARKMGVRTDVPFRELTQKERDIVFRGPAVKQNIVYQNKTTGEAGDMDFTYFNAVYTVENALSHVKDEKGMKRVERFLRTETCPDCGGTRLSAAARAPLVRGISLDAACRMTLSELTEWVKGVPDTMESFMKPMAESICESFLDNAKRLMDLGLSYLTLDRASSTLSTGERQRMQLARAVRNRTTGVLYVLDEPSIGLHPANIEGLKAVMEDLLADGNTVVLVDHDTQILRAADWMIEMGPEAGAGGGRVLGEGTIDDIKKNPRSVIGPYLAGRHLRILPQIGREELFADGTIRMETGPIHTVQDLSIFFPKGRMTVVTGVSGSGKTTMVLESLIPALEAQEEGRPLPAHVKSADPAGISRVRLIDASPIGINIRSTVATYAGIHDELRKAFAGTEGAKEKGLRAGAFSYNTGKLRCSGCDGTGSISLDVQFLPDVEITCPDCGGTRYGREAESIRWTNRDGKSYSLPQLMAMSVDEAWEACAGLPKVQRKLQVLRDLGLGYLTLGEETPGLSGGEAQRLKLAEEMGKGQGDSLFVFDEPSIGLHPKDVETLLQVLRTLLSKGATVLVIEHDRDIIRNADWIIDLGPGGGTEGGRVVFEGTAEEIKNCRESVTGKYL